MRRYLTNTKRLGRYHNPYTNNNSINNTSGNSNSQSYFNELASFYKEKSYNPLLDLDKPLFVQKRTSLQKDSLLVLIELN
jgi:hypothetical protein